MLCVVKWRAAKRSVVWWNGVLCGESVSVRVEFCVVVWCGVACSEAACSVVKRRAVLRKKC